MKKILSILSLCLLFMVQSIIYTACSLNPQAYITVDGLITEYYIGEELDISSAKIHYYASQDAETYTEIDLTEAMVTGFSTQEVGSFEMVITYKKLTTSISYTVQDSEYVSLTQQEAETLLSQAITNMGTFAEIKESTVNTAWGVVTESYVILTQNKRYTYVSEEEQSWYVKNGDNWEYYSIKEDVWDDIITYKRYEVINEFDNLIESYFSTINWSYVYVEGYLENGKCVIVYNMPEIMNIYNKIIIDKKNKIKSQISYILQDGQEVVLSTKSYKYFDIETGSIPLIPNVEWEYGGFHYTPQ